MQHADGRQGQGDRRDRVTDTADGGRRPVPPERGGGPILLDRPERRALLAEVRAADPASATERAFAEVARLEAEVPASDFDLDAALKRVEPATEPEALARIRFAVSGGTRLTWEELATLLDPAHPACDTWDFVRIATEVLDADRVASADLLPPGSAAEWRAFRTA
ncbi:hypothetical protein QFW82_01005 [Streptomyces malaysiensis subsp. malaysiensis]|uniref:hypothetical protein n=1 Tax=Streptomyces malaysiensis TaxID=92644 RepID=UPI0024C0C2F6|nr:hypothetical protein [Streptomyces sp. NA07423]WHX15689.1 hypothetical protein QFW82_01005 [Streptomyces sp. NA07423]